MRGHVRKRGNSWAIVYDEGVTEDGRRQQRTKSGFRTKEDAQNYLTSRLGELHRDEYVTPTSLTLREFLTTWTDGLGMKEAALTVEAYRGAVGGHDRQGREKSGHIPPTLGRLPLQKLNAGHLEALYRALLESGLEPATVRRVHNVLHKALKSAVRQKLITRNVAAEVEEKPKVGKKPRRTWSARELRQFIESTADDRLHAAWVFVTMTGVRRGELLGLRWFDLDLDGGKASIVQTVIPTGGKRWTFSETKTGKGRRIALDPTTLEALKEHRERQLVEKVLWGDAYQDHDLVFARENGEPLDPNGFSEIFTATAKRAGVAAIRLHDTRHTHATLCLAKGVHPKIVQERLGHSSIKITLDLYSHVTDGMDEEAVNAVSAFIFQTQTPAPLILSL